MLSLKSQISVLDNFVIREESISPVLAKELLKQESVDAQNTTDSSVKDVRFEIGNVRSLISILSISLF